MLASTLVGATETHPYSVNVDASCQVHVAAYELDTTAVERQTSDYEHHQCCLPHGTSATLAHQAFPALRDGAAKWHFPLHIHAPSLGYIGLKNEINSPLCDRKADKGTSDLNAVCECSPVSLYVVEN